MQDDPLPHVGRSPRLGIGINWVATFHLYILRWKLLKHLTNCLFIYIWFFGEFGEKRVYRLRLVYINVTQLQVTAV